jgi:PAS domain S-box-containing protein
VVAPCAPPPQAPVDDSEDQLRLLIEGVQDYAIFMLDESGRIASWNAGAQHIKGYAAEEIIGRHFSVFYPAEAKQRRWPEHELHVARMCGRFEDEGWRVRKDGSMFCCTTGRAGHADSRR